jgi:hypothetical protein
MCDYLDVMLPQYKFIDNYRPDWLTNPTTGKPLELDRYYPELKIAYEFQGEQHIRPVKGMGDFEYRKYLDELKCELCENRGVFLVKIESIDLIHDRMIGKTKTAIRLGKTKNNRQRNALKKFWKSIIAKLYKLDHKCKNYRQEIDDKYENVVSIHRRNSKIRAEILSKSRQATLGQTRHIVTPTAKSTPA